MSEKSAGILGFWFHFDLGGAMKISKIVCSLVLAIFLAAGCKDNSEEQAVVPPPVQTTPKIDTTAVLDVDTMAAVEEAVGMPPVPKGSGYAVQVASGTDETYARYQVDLWKKRGYEPFVSTVTHDNQTHYRVRLGLFATQSEAKKVVNELADKYSLKAWIDQTSN